APGHRSGLTMPPADAGTVTAPAGKWNAWSTDAGTSQTRFWDYRTAGNPANGIQPGEYFTLEDMRAGPVAPAGHEGRDYRDQTVKFITLSTFSTNSEVDISVDGFVLRLNDGRVVQINFGE